MRKLAPFACAWILAACSFPDVELAPPPSGEDATGARADATTDAEGDASSDVMRDPDGEPDGGRGGGGGGGGGGGRDADGGGVDVRADGGGEVAGDAGDAAMDGKPPPDASPEDVKPPDDVKPTDDAAREGGIVCDRDKDGFRSDEPGCGGRDCDDDDDRANPGVTDYLTYAPTPKTRGDWNCNTIVEKLFTPSFSCGGLLAADCETRRGFTDDPPCGATSDNFVTCKLGIAGLTCVEDTRGTQRQACK